MSLNIQSLPVVKVLTPETELNAQKFYSVLKGGSEVSYKEIRSTIE